jgi:hypothetical protein
VKCGACAAEMNGFSSVASAGSAEDDYLWECSNGCDAAPPWVVAVVLTLLFGGFFLLVYL